MTISKDCDPHGGPSGGSKGDGIVEGTAGADLIDINYTGDPEGDRIDAGDAILPGEGPNDDIVDAGAGDDKVLAGAGDDTVYAGSGDDYVDGGAGDGVIYGDSNMPGSAIGRDDAEIMQTVQRCLFTHSDFP